MSLKYVLEHPSDPDGQLAPGWGNRFNAMLIMKLVTPSLLRRDTDLRELGEMLRQAFPLANVIASRPLWLTGETHYAFALANNGGPDGNDFAAMSLLDIANPANVKVLAATVMYLGGGVNFMAGGDLTITAKDSVMTHYRAPVPTDKPLRLETYDDGYEDAATTALIRHLNGPDGHYVQLSNPLYALGSWLRAESEVMLLRPGQFDIAWFGPLLAAAAMAGATAHTLEADGCCLTPWDKPLAVVGQGLLRPLLLVHAGLEDRLRHEVAAARSGV